jgi:hypothetical protein
MLVGTLPRQLPKGRDSFIHTAEKISVVFSRFMMSGTPLLSQEAML